ncbi:MAG: isopentenyl-diphosphate Delta-isomerase [Flavobacteriia bacterium]|nr:isopentenyl-diphosphate Delta-isomerase [Flavobacteriia bacterium]
MNLVEVILVDQNDHVIGSMEKLEAHQKGLLHRAFSIFIFNSKNELLIHKRAMGKYHSEGLWTNTCCSHPVPGESIIEAAHRRLQEEMGFDCEIESVFSFVYDVALENQLIEHELDHVIVGRFDGKPVLNLEEASEYKWETLDNIIADIESNSDAFTYWFKVILEKYMGQLTKAI